MKTQTKKILLTAKGELNKSVTNSIKNCTFNAKENKIYPIHCAGSGNFISKKDYTRTVSEILTAQGYKFTKGNDAPRGGENGNFFKVSKVAFEFISNLKK